MLRELRMSTYAWIDYAEETGYEPTPMVTIRGVDSHMIMPTGIMLFNVGAL